MSFRELKSPNKIDLRKNFEADFHNKLIKQGRSRFRSINIYCPVFENFLHKKAFSKFEGVMGTGKSLLYYGCGVNIDPIREFYPYGYSITAVDISSESTRKISKSIKKNLNLSSEVTILEMDCEELDFDDESFDCVYGRAILHHLNIKKANSEIYRVMKKNGKAVFIEPLSTNIFINLFRKLTPQRRTPYERALNFKDINMLGQNFSKIEYEEFFLSAITLQILKNIIFKTDIKKSLFDKLIEFDDFLVKKFPFTKKLCWTTIIEMIK